MFARWLSAKVDDYIELRRSLGYAFDVQAATLRAFVAYVKRRRAVGPLTTTLAVSFVMANAVTPAVRARRYGVVVRLAEYLALFDARTPTLDPHALPRSRFTPPAHIIDDAELARLLVAARSLNSSDVLRGETLFTVLGLLASTGLRSGEARRLDRSDVDLASGLLQIRKTKFRKDRLVPVHPTTRARLRAYALMRDRAVPRAPSAAFFVTGCGYRLSSSTFGTAFRQARSDAGLLDDHPRMLRPHDLRHRFATTRIVQWYREKVDVQARLPVLAAYLGHARYSDTAYYVTGTAELLGIAATRVFGGRGGVR
ncbi:MAG: tyrosine-type recombinase/integrase [Labilithrix sp.]